MLFAPGPAREEYFTELADIRSSGRTMTDEDWIAVLLRAAVGQAGPGRGGFPRAGVGG